MADSPPATPISDSEMESLAQLLAQGIGEVCKDAGLHFALFLMKPESGGWSTWVTNSDRDSMITACRELLDAIERGADVRPITKKWPGR